tara:strand:- start:2778 stop:2972 length:195 start_codon:yes stop_codon:yes gene_type:complete
MINDPARIAYKSITPLEIEEEKPKRGLLSKGGSSRKEGDMSPSDIARYYYTQLRNARRNRTDES